MAKIHASRRHHALEHCDDIKAVQRHVGECLCRRHKRSVDGTTADGAVAAQPQRRLRNRLGAESCDFEHNCESLGRLQGQSIEDQFQVSERGAVLEAVQDDDL